MAIKNEPPIASHAQDPTSREGRNVPLCGPRRRAAREKLNLQPAYAKVRAPGRAACARETGLDFAVMLLSLVIL
jgi:hypothetical protein